MNYSHKLDSLPVLSINDFQIANIGYLSNSYKISALFCCPSDSIKSNIISIITNDTDNDIKILISEPVSEFESISNSYPMAQLFEREIFETHGIKPIGHPWLKPVRFINNKLEDTNFYSVKGDEIHEVAVGPVHAGIIEPGHFRFQCHGEDVFHLEIALGFQHRNIENKLVNGPNKKTLHLIENIAGDTTIGHTWAYSQNIEQLLNLKPNDNITRLRIIMLELERCANHIGDIGALANDIGFLPTASFCGRLRGDFLNLTAFICGNRFGKGMITPGGLNFNLDSKIIKKLTHWIDLIYKDSKGAANLLWERATVLSRFQNTGKISPKDAIHLGLVGPSSRSCGLLRDCRFNLMPFYKNKMDFKPSTLNSCDVYARAKIRWLEIDTSIALIKKCLLNLDMEDIPQFINQNNLINDSISVSFIEGWRGEICHVAVTNNDGKFKTYKIIDPSFHNWPGLALALRDQQISDFPLCNKSFNLSYCGHDL